MIIMIGSGERTQGTQKVLYETEIISPLLDMNKKQKNHMI